MLPAALRRFAANITPYFCLVLAVVTLGPHQFGFHLAELNAPQDVLTCREAGVQGGSPEMAHASWLAQVFRAAARSSSVATGTHHSSVPDCIPMTETQFATASSVFTIGGLVGALGAGPVCSRHGRLLAMRLTALLFLLGSTLEAFSVSVVMLAAGRVLNGAGAGAATVIVPLYISEVAPAAARGFFGAFTQITVNVGILFTQTLGYFLSHGAAWRFILGTGIALALVQFLGLLLAVPESPAWLVAHRGDVAQARRILQRIRGPGVPLDRDDAAAAAAAAWPAGDGSPDLPAEQQGLLDHSAAAAGASALDGDEAGIVRVAPPPASPSRASVHTKAPLGFFGVVRDPFCRPAVVAVIGIMFAQQICGINSVIMYSVSLLKGMLPLNSALLTIVISAANLVTTALCAPLPDRLGRKTCLLLSVVGQGTSSLVLALSIVYGLPILSALSVLTFVVFFAVGLGPVPFILASELVGQEAVGATQSWALGANYVATFLVAQFFPLVNSALNARLGGAGWVYFLFAACALLSTLFFCFFVPETNGKKDADEVWGRTTRID